jgi:D-3-phosphoglycerate dehydrogenase / 2-oxoglutarate reductase
MTVPKVLIATSPFGAAGRKPLDLMEATGWDLTANPKGRRLRAGEVEEMLDGKDAVIAGTEPYNRETIAHADRLKVIARVGIGLDSVDLEYCRERGVTVTYTPDAPSQSVAELTVGQIINLARHLHETDRSVREGAWNRLMGRLLCEMTIGVIGVGRIGKRVIKLLQPFETKIMACDTRPDEAFGKEYGLAWHDAATVFKEADLVTMHIPMNKRNTHFVNRERIALMKTGALLINTSRGGIVDTQALTDAVMQRHLGGVALDVFEEEPYQGPLVECENVAMSAHIGGSARLSRYMMELGAAEDCIRVLNGEAPENEAPCDDE